MLFAFPWLLAAAELATVFADEAALAAEEIAELPLYLLAKLSVALCALEAV
ncbi:hypothetical protein ACIUDV_09655 [Limosilactobacillus reuteri]|uniref:hypothetical protein n=1 Tax=Limosilactobacillus reuteri TaxID=1598 RepID=UPI00386957E6